MLAENHAPKLPPSTRVEIGQWAESVLLLKKDAEWEPQNANARLFAQMSFHNRSNPRRFATAIASVRLRTFSFLNRDWTWLLTVTSVIARPAPISLLGLPSASSRKTSTSRGVSSSAGNRSASFAATAGAR